MLKTRDVRLYQAETFAKYSGVTQYDQPFHADYTNHTMLPPRADGRWRQAQMFLFLSDVTAAHGATRIVSRELTRDVPVMQLSFPKARVSDERHAEWEAAAVSAVGPRGSLLIYSADTVHRGTEMSACPAPAASSSTSPTASPAPTGWAPTPGRARASPAGRRWSSAARRASSKRSASRRPAIPTGTRPRCRAPPNAIPGSISRRGGRR